MFHTTPENTLSNTNKTLILPVISFRANCKLNQSTCYPISQQVGLAAQNCLVAGSSCHRNVNSSSRQAQTGFPPSEVLETTKYFTFKMSFTLPCLGSVRSLMPQARQVTSRSRVQITPLLLWAYYHDRTVWMAFYHSLLISKIFFF